MSEAKTRTVEGLERALRSIIQDFEDYGGSGKSAIRMVYTAREALGLEWDEDTDTWKEK